jgi:hypothetical protein
MKAIIKQLNEQTVSHGLVYTKEVIEEIQEQLKDKELIGEFAPKQKRITREQVDLMNACVVSKNYRIEDGNLIADIKFIGDKKDILINDLVDYQFGIRALSPNNSMNIKDYKIITFDLIQNKG